MSKFKLISVTDGWGISCEIALRQFSLDLTDDKLSIGSGTGFVPPGKKSLPVPMLSQIFGRWTVLSTDALPLFMP